MKSAPPSGAIQDEKLDDDHERSAMTTEDEPVGPRIVRPESVNLRAVWPREDSDFTPWLADNLDWLDLLDLGHLNLVGVEVSVPSVNRNLDILAETDSGRRVAIENQYNEADHDHFTRALAYAVGLDAKAIVVIAEYHRQEFVAVADYLNTAREALGEDDGIAVLLVNVKVEAIADFRVPRFEVLSKPNTWLEQIRTSGARTAKSSAFESVAAFLEAVTPDRREAFGKIIEEWLVREGAGLKFTSTVSLLAPNPFVPGSPTRSYFLLETSGTLVIQRGYYLGTGAFPDEESEALLDEQIDRYFTHITAGEQRYYPNTRTATPENVRSFSDWLIGYFASA